ncbi:MAG: hypothetical protein WDZ90_02995 [Candidatus Paceibacterota bacterium]
MSVLFFSLFALFLLFVFVKREIVVDLLLGSFPPALFFSLLPVLISNFAFGTEGLLAHYLGISLLFGVYATLLKYLFFQKRLISLSSLSVGVLGMAGITLGISCISCGAIGVLLLLSVIGVASSSALILTNSFFFLVIGESLLVASIALILIIIKRLS